MCSLGQTSYGGTVICDDMEVKNVIKTNNLEVTGKINYPLPATAIDIEGDGVGLNIDIGHDSGSATSTNCVNIGQTCGTQASDTSVNIGLACGFDNSQGPACVAIGNRAGRENQSNGDGVGACVAVGHYAGNTDQAGGGVAIGSHAADNGQGIYGVALGGSAGRNNQGDNSVCVGFKSGEITCHDNCIMLNASGAATASAAVSSFLVNPIRTLVNPAGAGIAGSLWWDGNEIFANP
jgi:hypothetical protein